MSEEAARKVSSETPKWYEGLSIREKKKLLKENKVDTLGCVTVEDLNELLEKISFEAERNNASDVVNKKTKKNSCLSSKAAKMLGLDQDVEGIPMKAARFLGIDQLDCNEELPRKKKMVDWIRNTAQSAKKRAIQRTRRRLRQRSSIANSNVYSSPSQPLPRLLPTMKAIMTMMRSLVAIGLKR